MKNIDNIFLLFSPGTGGNHLANILSLPDKFVSRATVQDYNEHLHSSAYANAHYSQIDNLDPDVIETLPATGNVLCGHFYSYNRIDMLNLTDKFVNKVLVVIETPVSGLAYKRYMYHNDKVRQQLYNEQRLIYTTHFIEKYFNQKTVSLPCETIFEHNLDRLYSIIKNKLDLDIDKNLCNQMHNKWHWQINIEQSMKPSIPQHPLYHDIENDIISLRPVVKGGNNVMKETK
jgi:hypothetical protein